eukprot:7461042-Pyramimonas_sp.AAC.1
MVASLRSLTRHPSIRNASDPQPKHGGEPDAPNAHPKHPRCLWPTTQARTVASRMSLTHNPDIRDVSDPQPRRGGEPVVPNAQPRHPRGLCPAAQARWRARGP